MTLSGKLCQVLKQSSLIPRWMMVAEEPYERWTEKVFPALEKTLDELNLVKEGSYLKEIMLHYPNNCKINVLFDFYTDFWNTPVKLMIWNAPHSCACFFILHCPDFALVTYFSSQRWRNKNNKRKTFYV